MEYAFRARWKTFRFNFYEFRRDKTNERRNLQRVKFAKIARDRRWKLVVRCINCKKQERRNERTRSGVLAIAVQRARIVAV